MADLSLGYHREDDAFSLQQLLDHDPRPAFVLDLQGAKQGEALPLHPLFCNQALAGEESLLTNIIQATNADNSDKAVRKLRQFRRWILSSRLPSSDVHSVVEFAGVCWTNYTVHDRYRVISGNVCGHRSGTTTSPRSSPSRTSSSSNFLPPKIMSFNVRNAQYDPRPPPTLEDSKIALPEKPPKAVATDWTATQPDGLLTAHETFARETDWAATPPGPMSSWNREFRELVNLVMRNPHPCTLFWGTELTMVYNESYSIEVAGNKHPGLMGSGFFGPFAELWEGLKTLFEECGRTGKSIRKENDRLLIERYGYLEETFFSWSFAPMYNRKGLVLGFYNAPFETTYQTVSSRRMETLQRLVEEVAGARSASQFWRGAISGLETNPYDIVFALVYSVTDPSGSGTVSASSSSDVFPKGGVLEGTIGVPEDHPAARPKIDLQGKDGLVPHFRDAIHAKAPIILRDEDGTVPEVLLEGINFAGFEIPPGEVLVIPICSPNSENVLAILTIGLNPRLQYDQDYQTFVAMLNRQLTTTLASVLSAEEEARRNLTAAELAALQRDRLTEELAVQTSRMRRMTELSPLGMFLISPEGVLLEANDRYYEMTNLPREQSEMSFLDAADKTSVELATKMWERLIINRKVQSEEILLSYNYNTEIDETTGKPSEPWVLASALPEIGADGEIRSVMGSITDIAHLHFARRLQDQRLREAEELKIQQNAFIDITSHEMRNPLSAVLICAEDIRESLHQYPFDDACLKVVSECIEAANTISLCVQHQKSIVDDVLTISKLNSNLLLITPLPTQPVRIIQQAMNMFRNETQFKQIDLSLQLHPSIQDLNVDWAMLDPSRILQITVNLLTNAIKFTQQASLKSIRVHVGISLSPPIPSTKHFEYVPTRDDKTTVDITSGDDWGSGGVLYLRVRVTDTGIGLTPEEKQRLFERFAQASPRTHAQYGGSGLGLFISRQLAELHGGQIGAASEAGVGSTFGFFVKCRRGTPPPSEERPAFTPIQDEIDSPTSTATKRKLNASDTQVVKPSRKVSFKSLEPIKPVIEHDHKHRVHVLVVEDNLVN